jgi:hypothetical protein
MTSVILVARDERISVMFLVTRFCIAKTVEESESDVRIVDRSEVKVV